MKYSTRQKLEWLLTYARHVASNAPLYQPIDVEEIAARESLPIIRCRSDLKVPALLEASPKGDLVIKLNLSSNTGVTLTPRERFTVAHELAHGLLVRRFAWNPLSGEEHRSCESLCNQFAANLLVPDILLKKLQMRSAADVVTTTLRISRIYNVSHEVFARRITSMYDNVAMLCCWLVNNTKGERVLQVRWSAGSVFGETLPRQKHLCVSSTIGQFLSPLFFEDAPKGKFIKGNAQDVFVSRVRQAFFLCTINRRTDDCDGA